MRSLQAAEYMHLCTSDFGVTSLPSCSQYVDLTIDWMVAPPQQLHNIDHPYLLVFNPLQRSSTRSWDDSFAFRWLLSVWKWKYLERGIIKINCIGCAFRKLYSSRRLHVDFYGWIFNLNITPGLDAGTEKDKFDSSWLSLLRFARSNTIVYTPDLREMLRHAEVCFGSYEQHTIFHVSLREITPCRSYLLIG